MSSMFRRLETVFGVLFLTALALALVLPNSGVVGLIFLTLVVLGTPFVIIHLGRTLYKAARLGYVIPDEVEGPAYRSDKPVTFWSNVVLSLAFIPVLIGGTILIFREILRLAAQTL